MSANVDTRFNLICLLIDGVGIVLAHCLPVCPHHRMHKDNDLVEIVQINLIHGSSYYTFVRHNKKQREIVLFESATYHKK